MVDIVSNLKYRIGLKKDFDKNSLLNKFSKEMASEEGSGKCYKKVN